MILKNIIKHKNKIYCGNEFDYSNSSNLSMIYGLYFKDFEEGGEYILGVSYTIDILYEFKNKYMDENEQKNSWIKSIDLLLMSKISLFKNIGLMLKCNKSIEKKYIIEKKNFINSEEIGELFCIEVLENYNGHDKIPIQYLIEIDKKKSNDFEFDKLMKYYNGHISTHPIVLNKFYPESIGTNDYIFSVI
jgi:hypothetical protein